MQTNELDDESSGMFSPGFVSMHPAGGEEISDENKNKMWIPDKTKWSPPEGTQDAPSKNPLSISLSKVFERNAGLDAQHVLMVNRVALHKCSNYCLRSKSKNGEFVKYCRFHFGEQDQISKKVSGKETRPYNALITDDTHPRYEGPRDHPRLIMHIKAKLLTWLANCDTQPIIHENITALQKYIAGYACKGGASTQDLILVYKKLINTCDENTPIRSLAQKVAYENGRNDRRVRSYSRLYECGRQTSSQYSKNKESGT